MDTVSELLLIFVCLLFSGFFSGSETALLRLRTHQLDVDISSGKHGLAALAARDLIGNTGKLLVTILLGNNVVNILAASTAAALAVRTLGEERGLVASTVILTVLVLVVCEILPKAVAARNPRRAAYAVALPLYLVHGLLRPVHWLFERGVDPLVRRIAGEAEHGGGGSEELLELARKVRSEPQAASSPIGILGNAARAVERTVAEVMTPRTAIFAAPLDTPPEELLERMLEERYTRIPLWRESIDSIAGFLHFKDLVALVREGGTSVAGAVLPVLRVPESKPVYGMLADMQRESISIAMVKDEFGITVGLVTQEDILEELVGELRDEFDGDEHQDIGLEAEGVYVVRGGVSVLDFNRASGWRLPGARGDSLGGLVFDALGREPAQGDKVRVGSFELVVLRSRGTHIQSVRVEQVPEPDAAE